MARAAIQPSCIYHEPSCEMSIYCRIYTLMQEHGNGYKIRKSVIEQSFKDNIGRIRFDKAWNALISKGYIADEIHTGINGWKLHRYSLPYYTGTDEPQEAENEPAATCLQYVETCSHDQIKDKKDKDIDIDHSRQVSAGVLEQNVEQTPPADVYQILPEAVRTDQHFRWAVVMEIVKGVQDDLQKVLEVASRRFRIASAHNKIVYNWCYFKTILYGLVKNWQTFPKRKAPAACDSAVTPARQKRDSLMTPETIVNTGKTMEPHDSTVTVYDSAVTFRDRSVTPATRENTYSTGHRTPDKRNRFNDFPQREYDFSALEAALLA